MDTSGGNVHTAQYMTSLALLAASPLFAPPTTSMLSSAMMRPLSKEGLKKGFCEAISIPTESFLGDE